MRERGGKGLFWWLGCWFCFIYLFVYFFFILTEEFWKESIRPVH